MTKFFLMKFKSSFLFAIAYCLLVFILDPLIPGLDKRQLPDFWVCLVGLGLGSIITTAFFMILYVQKTEVMKDSKWRYADRYEVFIAKNYGLSLSSISQEILSTYLWLTVSERDGTLECHIGENAPKLEELGNTLVRSPLLEYVIRVELSNEGIRIIAKNPIKIKVGMGHQHKLYQKHFAELIAKAVAKA